MFECRRGCRSEGVFECRRGGVGGGVGVIEYYGVIGIGRNESKINLLKNNEK